MTESANLERFVQDVFKESWELFVKDIVLYILAGLITAVVGGVTLGILLGPLFVGLVGIIRKRRRGQPASAGDVFSGLSQFVPALLLAIVVGLAVILGSFLCVLPGLAVAWAAMFAFHELTYKQAGLGDCISQSVALIKAQPVPTLILFLIIGVLNGLGGAIFLGSIFTFPFGIIAITVAYEKLANVT
jgi:hypothetical protein